VRTAWKKLDVKDQYDRRNTGSVKEFMKQIICSGS